MQLRSGVDIVVVSIAVVVDDYIDVVFVKLVMMEYNAISFFNSNKGKETWKMRISVVVDTLFNTCGSTCAK